MQRIKRITVSFIIGFIIFNFIFSLTEIIILNTNGLNKKFFDVFISEIYSNILVYIFIYVIIYISILIYDICIVNKLNKKLVEFKRMKEEKEDEE